jgi:hypothetical protein
VVPQAGAVLLLETVRKVRLDQVISAHLASWRKPRFVHDPGKVPMDLALLCPPFDDESDCAARKGITSIAAAPGAAPTTTVILRTDGARPRSSVSVSVSADTDRSSAAVSGNGGSFPHTAGVPPSAGVLPPPSLSALRGASVASPAETAACCAGGDPGSGIGAVEASTATAGSVTARRTSGLQVAPAPSCCMDEDKPRLLPRVLVTWRRIGRGPFFGAREVGERRPGRAPVGVIPAGVDNDVRRGVARPRPRSAAGAAPS